MARKPYRTVRSAGGPGARAQRPVGPALFWAVLIVTGLCVAIILWLVIDGVPVEDVGLWPRILIVAILAVFIVSALASTEVIPWGKWSWVEWRRPKVLGMFVYLLTSAAGFVVGIANIWNPPVATEARQIAIQQRVEAIGAETGDLLAGQADLANAVGIGRASLIRRNIEGVWGEAGCGVTYRIRLADRSLLLTSLHDEPGMASFREEYTILSDSDRTGPNGERLSVLEASEVGGSHDGQSVTFTYGGNGSSAWLEWKHRSQAINAPRFVQCGGA